MDFIRENWWYLLLLCGFVYMMFSRGGCCGGHSHGGHDHSRHSRSGHDRSNEHYDLEYTGNQIEMVLDPECGMYVDPRTAVIKRIDGKRYYFCSEVCGESFVRKQENKRAS